MSVLLDQSQNFKHHLVLYLFPDLFGGQWYVITVKISKNPELLAQIENQKIKISRKKTVFVPMVILHYF